MINRFLCICAAIAATVALVAVSGSAQAASKYQANLVPPPTTYDAGNDRSGLVPGNDTAAIPPCTLGNDPILGANCIASATPCATDEDCGNCTDFSAFPGSQAPCAEDADCTAPEVCVSKPAGGTCGPSGVCVGGSCFSDAGCGGVPTSCVAVSGGPDDVTPSDEPSAANCRGVTPGTVNPASKIQIKSAKGKVQVGGKIIIDGGTDTDEGPGLCNGGKICSPKKTGDPNTCRAGVNKDLPCTSNADCPCAETKECKESRCTVATDVKCKSTADCPPGGGMCSGPGTCISEDEYIVQCDGIIGSNPDNSPTCEPEVATLCVPPTCTPGTAGAVAFAIIGNCKPDTVRPGAVCNTDDNCVTCVAVCAGGANAGRPCTVDAECPASICTASIGQRFCSNTGAPCVEATTCPVGGECSATAGPAVLTGDEVCFNAPEAPGGIFGAGCVLCPFKFALDFPFDTVLGKVPATVEGKIKSKVSSPPIEAFVPPGVNANIEFCYLHCPGTSVLGTTFIGLFLPQPHHCVFVGRSDVRKSLAVGYNPNCVDDDVGNDGLPGNGGVVPPVDCVADVDAMVWRSQWVAKQQVILTFPEGPGVDEIGTCMSLSKQKEPCPTKWFPISGETTGLPINKAVGPIIGVSGVQGEAP